MYRMKMANPRHVGKSLEKAALVFSILRLLCTIMKIRVAKRIVVAPTPNPKKK
jgi:hypothetical protein